MNLETVIQVSSICKCYGPYNALNDVSFEVNKGELFGIIGTSGAGKTTLLEMLMGLRRPDEGTIEVLGMDAIMEAKQLKEYIGMHMYSNSLVDNLTVREALELFQSFYIRQNDIDKIIEDLELEPYVNKPVKRLSGGLQQRIALAFALVNDPEIIFLDEPTTGLDKQARADYWCLLMKLKSQGKTIVMASHDMGEMQRNCDRIAVLRKGDIVRCDSPQQLISQIPEGCFTMEGVYVHFAYAGV
ncbi:ABC-2 type transport system ATP-binding protein [Paenibacillus catalpae]|uniref:ABC-2 type transport system ATP-binding protein n=1 Tax=Paenibacillus catalpae TaxID=1045775 RepID=A0A1I2HKB0_9BACL|nr:ABC transporter ATP-binding protein [Paenibacillus catalpae]SFF29287.1 ABC-2 type transport system ATP-binding protein [Paenibacillus catalpae]